MCNTLSNNFIKMDLETKSIEGTLVPYCVSLLCILIGWKKSTFFYITDFNSSDEIMNASIFL